MKLNTRHAEGAAVFSCRRLANEGFIRVRFCRGNLLTLLAPAGLLAPLLVMALNYCSSSKNIFIQRCSVVYQPMICESTLCDVLIINNPQETIVALPITGQR